MNSRVRQLPNTSIVGVADQLQQQGYSVLAIN